MHPGSNALLGAVLAWAILPLAASAASTASDHGDQTGARLRTTSSINRDDMTPQQPLPSRPARAAFVVERQVTSSASNHILTNANVWSPDGRWIVYDVRSDPQGARFDGTRIERVNVDTGEVQTLYESRNGAGCGVVTYNTVKDEVVFIHGPEHPTPEWTYGASRRRGVIVEAARPGIAINLDARNLVPPFTPGALRGGSHVHVFSPDGKWVSFTYEDQVLAEHANPVPGDDTNQRNVGVSVPVRAVRVPKSHPRNHDGAWFSVLVTRTVRHPRPGSDEISRACEEGWVGTRGYVRSDGVRQERALAFQGEVVTDRGDVLSEVFIVNIPDDVTRPGDDPLEGTLTRRPCPPAGTSQRRLTRTSARKHPGIQGPRHWLRSSPDGSRIAFLMRDDDGVVQLWTVSPNGGDPVLITRNPWSIASAFSWSPDGQCIAHVMDNSVFVTDVATGESRRLTPRSPDAQAPLALACVFSPDGRRIAYVRPVPCRERLLNQIFIVPAER